MIKTNLKGAAGVQINIKDLSGRPNTKAAPYRIGLVGWTPKGPSNIPVLVTTESELYSIFGTPKKYSVNQVYLLHNAKILLNAGAEVVIVRTVQLSSGTEILNYGVYTWASGGASTITSPTDSTKPTAISNNMYTVVENKKNLDLAASTIAASPFTMFLKYPGFDKYFTSIQTFESDITTDINGNAVTDMPIYETAHSLNISPSLSYYSSERAAFKSYVQGLGLYEDSYSVPSTDTDNQIFLVADVAGEYYAQTDTGLYTGNTTGYYSKTVVTTGDRFKISTSLSDTGRFAVYGTGTTGEYVDDTAVLLYGDARNGDKFYKLNGISLSDFDGALSDPLPLTVVENEALNEFLDLFVIVRLYESLTSQNPLETIYATTKEYVTDSGDQLDITTISSNLLVFKTGLSTDSVIDGCVSRTELKGGTSDTNPVRNSQALVYAWGMFADSTNLEVSLLVDGGSSISAFGTDRENDGLENGDMAVVTAMLKVSSGRMDAPCIIDLPKRSNVNELVKYFKKYPSIGNEVEGSTASFATFWGNAQDGRQIINDVFNKKQIEAARSVFKAIVAYNVYTTSYPWQTQWGPNRGLITSPSLGTINPRTFPDEIGLLSQSRINPSKLTATGEYFWDDFTLMSKSSVLQRWHAVCFLANLNKRYRKMLEQYVAELNTSALRKTIWNMLNEDLNFIKNLADPAGLYDYYVICDETNNTPEVIDAGQLNVDIGLEIVRDTRVINLTTTLYRTGGIVESGIKV